MSVKYSFNEKNEFIIEGYDKAKTFASFLPGIAGIDGIPMWSFYANRGQCLGSFGVKDKDSTIMEFFPANKMYQQVEIHGFRTFIKLDGKIHEIFSSMSQDNATRKMIIEKNILSIEELNETLQIKVRVTYFTMPRESFAAIVRKVEIENLEEKEKEIEVLDGLTQILPYGIKNGEYQAMSNLFRAWFDVFNVENKIPYYKLRSTTSDSAEVGQIDKGNFYISFSNESNGLIAPIFDMDLIFGSNTSYTFPSGWDCPVEEMHKRIQVPQNKVSGGFTGAKTVLRDKFMLYTLIGHIASTSLINGRKDDFTPEYIEKKENEARELVDVFVKDTYTKTSNHFFDKYIDSCYLDNILRGGYPLLFKAGDKTHVYHVYSRKHGDTEREYNFFSLEPAYYSQGNGNFRDVNQNRRNDILFNPEVKDFNVKQFISLIQADGYNPLGVKGSTFSFEGTMDEILNLVSKGKEGVEIILKGKFTPGQLITYLVDNKAELTVPHEELLVKVLEKSSQNYEAEFGEGYWTDHWTYNMDLVDTYLNVYPDRLESFVFEDNTYRFFDSAVRVLPREDKYVLANGKVHQYGAILEDEEKCHKLKRSMRDTSWLRTDHGTGKIYETTLYTKLISLTLNKFVTLDPYGMGIEMEANKPGWNDAMNGLPGIFGSGINETAELKRIVDFIIEVSAKFDKTAVIPVEMAALLRATEKALDAYAEGHLDDYQYWDETASLREKYREEIRFGIDGKEEQISTEEVLRIFEKCHAKLEEGLEKALALGGGIYPTYLSYEAKSYVLLEGKHNPVNGYPNVKVTDFECKPLPLFLEGPTRMLKSIKDTEEAQKLYTAIRQSAMYDKKLGMYKTSVPLDDTTHEIGRARAFTAGWLEREAVFMHMEYKYLFALLKAGLYEEYYEDMQTALVPFIDPAMYGRSTLENSSFIASSVNPDPEVHGRGFVARLSGSTAELLSIWFTMMAGHKVFSYEKNELRLELCPILPGWLFDEEGKVSFRFLGKVDVTYYNPAKANTYGASGVKAERTVLTGALGEKISLAGGTIGSPYAKDIREGHIKAIDIYFA